MRKIIKVYPTPSGTDGYLPAIINQLVAESKKCVRFIPSEKGHPLHCLDKNDFSSLFHNINGIDEHAKEVAIQISQQGVVSPSSFEESSEEE
jgi:hypothetical protein